MDVADTGWTLNAVNEIEEIPDRFQGARRRMVDTQLRRRGILDERVLKAMEHVARHVFVPRESLSDAHADSPLRIGEGQTISQPYIVGLMTELLEIEAKHRVLEVGTGCGYQTAVLAELAETVFTVEIREPLLTPARLRLDGLGYDNIRFRLGDGHAGWGEFAPFDRIIVTAAARQVPPRLVEQMRAGSRMVIPVGSVTEGQVLRLVTKTTGFAIDIKDTVPVRFVPMTSNIEEA